MTAQILESLLARTSQEGVQQHINTLCPSLKKGWGNKTIITIEGICGMNEHEPGLVLKETGKRTQEPGGYELRETLLRVDRIVEEFYEIHGPLIKDQGQNP